MYIVVSCIRGKAGVDYMIAKVICDSLADVNVSLKNVCAEIFVNRYYNESMIINKGAQ